MGKNNYGLWMLHYIFINHDSKFQGQSPWLLNIIKERRNSFKDKQKIQKIEIFKILVYKELKDVMWHFRIMLILTKIVQCFQCRIIAFLVLKTNEGNTI